MTVEKTTGAIRKAPNCIIEKNNYIQELIVPGHVVGLKQNLRIVCACIFLDKCRIYLDNKILGRILQM